jgi:H+/gluconate symporter-like permease
VNPNNQTFPKKHQSGLIFIGYVLAIFGSIIAVVIGYTLKSKQAELPDGNRAYKYSENNRKHGQQIATIAVVMFCIRLALKILR